MPKIDSDDIYMDTHVLDDLLKTIKEAKVFGEIGILGSNNTREGTDETNAAIGLKHEFGDPSANPPLPIRSFLRMPLTTMMQKYLEKSDAFTPDALRQVVKQRSLAPWVRAFLYTAEQVVFDAFNSAGFGQWTPSNMAFKKNHQTLVETQQLRNSITTRIVGDK